MSEGYLGEIRMFAGNFAPAGWAFCEGQSLSTSDYSELFSLIGTTYGGDGSSTFNLPNLQGAVPVQQGNGYTLGQTGGSTSVTLTTAQLPVHSHAYYVSANNASQASPQNNYLAAASGLQPYGMDGPDSVMAGSAVSSAGASQPHDNTQPYLCVNFIIALFGPFPT